MQGVILAGGIGSRLEQLTGGNPKCLVDIGGKALILHQLEALSDQGVGPVLIVVGYRQEAVRQVVGPRAEYVVNERFAETNSLYSLMLARPWVKGPFVLLNSDLLFSPEILARLLEEPGNALAYDSTSSRGREQTKVAVRDRRVIDLGKDLPAASARGESLGLLKFEAAGAQAMFDVAAHLIADGREKAWVIEATRAVCRTEPISAVNVAGLPWTEVDFPHDLEQARREVWPQIWKRRWRRSVYWNRTRWLAAGVAAAVLTVAGWFASSRLGPASVDWENVAPASARTVSLTLPSGSQRWWVVNRRDSMEVLVDGGAPLRLEFRLVMVPERADTGRYVVALSVDGRSHNWHSLTATPDSEAVLAGAPVGDRDRIELTLTPGRHTLHIGFLAGHGDQLLARVRRQE